jgi:hypothetical protein
MSGSSAYVIAGAGVQLRLGVPVAAGGPGGRRQVDPARLADPGVPLGEVAG